MDTYVVDLERNEHPTFLLADEIGEEDCKKKQDAPELRTLGASVACATSKSTTEYTTEAELCQAVSIPRVPVTFLGDTCILCRFHGNPCRLTLSPKTLTPTPIPSFSDLEATIASAAQDRIENAYSELQETRARFEREHAAREKALRAMQSRRSEIRASLENLAGERVKMEERARAFLGGEVLKTILERIHLAFNARELELESDLRQADAELAEAMTEAQAAELTDELELQLGEQELESLERAAPEVAERMRLVLSAEENLARAWKMLQEGQLREAALLLEQSKAGGADPIAVAEGERELREANASKLVEDLIARIKANPEQVGATRRIHKLVQEAHQAGAAEQVASTANRVLIAAREAANDRFLQARPIADHLGSEGYVPVVGDGRIEAWREIQRNGNSTVWKLERILTLRGRSGWITELPRNAVTQKELPARVRHSRWYRPPRTEPTG